jgi:hypothetical protein
MYGIASLSPKINYDYLKEAGMVWACCTRETDKKFINFKRKIFKRKSHMADLAVDGRISPDIKMKLKEVYCINWM